MTVTYWPQLFASRLLYDTDRSGIAADDTDVTGWLKTAKFIVAVQIGYQDKDTSASSFKLQWRNVTDAGSFADVGASGEIIYAATSGVLADGNAVTSTERKCTAPTGMTWADGLENVADNLLPDSGTVDLASDYYTEHQWALDPASAHDGDEYEFQLYNVTQGAAVGTCLCTLRIKGATQTLSAIGAVAGAEAFGTQKLSLYLKAVGAIAGAEAFGTLKVNHKITGVGNVAGAEDFGATVVALASGPQELSLVGAIAGAEAFGTQKLNHIIASVGAIVGGEAFGTLKTTLKIMAAGAIASLEAFGTAVLNFAMSGVGAIASGETFGETILPSGISGAGGIESEEEFGTPSLARKILTTAIESAEALGSMVLVNRQIITDWTIATLEQFGSVILVGGEEPESVDSSLGMSMTTIIR